MESQKFKYDCQGKIDTNHTSTKPWLQILERVIGNTNILKGIVDKHRIVAVKFGSPGQLQEDYDIALRLYQLHIPNCLKYYCYFTCQDDLSEISNRDFSVKPYLCKGPGNTIGLTVMPYYELGSVQQYPWKAEEFAVYLNVLHQAMYALVEMYRLGGYVHPDLHLDNLMMRRTRKTNVVYGERELPLNGLYAVVIDFETRRTGTVQLVQAIAKILHLASAVSFPDGIVRSDVRAITELKASELNYPGIFDTIDRLIGTFELRPISKMSF